MIRCSQHSRSWGISATRSAEGRRKLSAQPPPLTVPVPLLLVVVVLEVVVVLLEVLVVVVLLEVLVVVVVLLDVLVFVWLAPDEGVWPFDAGGVTVRFAVCLRCL